MSLAAMAIAATLATAAQDTPLGRNRDDAAPPGEAAAAPARPPAAPRPAGADPTADQIAAWLKADASPLQPLDPRAADSGDFAPTRRERHGEVGAFVSNRGYGGYATTQIPLGEASELDLGVSAAQVHTRFGRASPRSLSVGLYIDGRDLQRWISRDRCNVPRWGVALPDDPLVLADGSCAPRERTAAAPLRPPAP